MSAPTNSCITNLRQIEGAKTCWSLEAKHETGYKLTSSDILAINQYIKGGGPYCPAGGSYNYNSVGAAPTCSIPGHSI